jgi:hypothetical protein
LLTKLFSFLDCVFCSALPICGHNCYEDIAILGNVRVPHETGCFFVLIPVWIMDRNRQASLLGNDFCETITALGTTSRN